MTTGIVALIIGFGVGMLVLWLRNRNIKVSWYEWLIGIVGLLLLLFAIFAYFPSRNEQEMKAANMFLLVAGVPGIILMVLAAALAWRRKQVTT
jgi:uncharacterized membrane protein